MIVVVDYGMGNIGSVLNMLQRLGVEAAYSGCETTIQAADALILPGVGTFDHAMQRLNDLGLIPVLQRKVMNQQVPVLGICLGMQLFAKSSEEGTLSGLGWLDMHVKRFTFDSVANLRVPHMGWNHVQPTRSHILFEGLELPRYYFVHSYHIPLCSHPYQLATTQYGTTFISAVAQGNILGVQFHPEKSHRFGLSLLKNFVRYVQHVQTKNHSLLAAS